MACVQVPTANADSEMEEGEIIDDVDELSDISSEEEFLLRQRLQVLENYNNALERKKSKTIVGSGKECERAEALCDLSEISGTDVDDGVSKEIYRSSRKQKQLKPQHKHRKCKQTGKENGKQKEHKQKIHHYRKKNECKVLSETSEESDDEYRNKRRKLANAVSFNNKEKSDISTLKDRLTKMMCGNRNEGAIMETHFVETESQKFSETYQDKAPEANEIVKVDDAIVKPTSVCDLIDLCTDEDTNIVSTVSQDSVDAVIVEKSSVIICAESSDEDIELLRQHALQTKASKLATDKTKQIFTGEKTAATSEDEDSDTTELRMICLKSALLKKAIEMKQKQKQQKRLSQSANIQDEFDIVPNKISSDLNNCENNTDVESVDMEIGSDGDDKGKDYNTENDKIIVNNNIEKCASENKFPNEELEEDEDLLRAKLLTSLSKNLPNLVDLNVISSVFKEPSISNKKEVSKHSSKIEEKKFIIRLGESDSEGEHEATKNLTRMHHKLSEQEEFQNKLDLFLKSSRLQVEQNLLPDVVQPPVLKAPPKFVPKTMNHLPKSEQIEYKNLVRRMAELERMKQIRLTSINLENKIIVANETLKPHNAAFDSHKFSSTKLDEKIALSRKKIAEESAKMLKLKEEAQKLSQKYKITATELRNITTAITFNKKQQRAIQNGLFKVRLQHQMLLKSSTNLKPKHLPTISEPISKPLVKVQKENNPATKEHRDLNILKTVKVSVVNDLNKKATITHPRLSVQVDIANNKKTIKIPKNAERIVDLNNHTEVESRTVIDVRNERVEVGGGTVQTKNRTDIPTTTHQEVTDYKSPLEALRCRNWEEDPNTFLCPYEIGGSCRDPDCKYLHPEIPSHQ